MSNGILDWLIGDIDYLRGLTVLDDVVAESVTTETQNTTTRYVPEFGSLQAAINDLPGTGGRVILTESIAETDITVDKPALIQSAAAGHFDSNQDGDSLHIDTSGGDGIQVVAEGAALRDISVTGDGTGYGIKIGQTETFYPSIELTNVSVRECFDGFVFDGNFAYCTFDITAKFNDNMGVIFDLNSPNSSNYLAACTFERLHALDNGKDGVWFDGTGGGEHFTGNTVQNLSLEGNGRHGLLIGGPIVFQGNVFMGYGAEKNTNADLDLDALNTDGTAVGNHMLIRRANGPKAYNSENWATWTIGQDPADEVTATTIAAGGSASIALTNLTSLTRVLSPGDIEVTITGRGGASNVGYDITNIWYDDTGGNWNVDISETQGLTSITVDVRVWR